MEVLEDFQMGYENLKCKLDGLRVFGKVIFPSTPVTGINNDQSLKTINVRELYWPPVVKNENVLKLLDYIGLLEICLFPLVFLIICLPSDWIFNKWMPVHSG